MRKSSAALLAATLGALTVLSPPAKAQAPNALPSPALPSAALPSQPSTPGVAPVAGRMTPEKPASVADTSYWKPAPPKPKPSALRRFFERMTASRDTSANQDVVKVHRDPTTGRTNTINSKPWMDARP